MTFGSALACLQQLSVHPEHRCMRRRPGARQGAARAAGRRAQGGARGAARARRYCVCELPYNPDAYMVQCEACEDWFHPRCVGSTQAAVEPAASFSCPECQQVPPRWVPPALHWLRTGAGGAAASFDCPECQQWRVRMTCRHARWLTG